MADIKRTSRRYDDIGRVEIESLCALPAVLDNVSHGGLKIHYNVPVSPDLEADYELKIVSARMPSAGSFELLCHPMWFKERGACTEIGLKILRFKDYARFFEYVTGLGVDEDSDSLEDQISDSDVFII